MIQADVLHRAREQLAAEVAQNPADFPNPINCSLWIAMSLLQKAIRRGREELATRAAATLLTHSPERLWRRIGGIAFEDVGLGDLKTVSLVVGALGGKKIRASLGGEWPVATCLVGRMAQACKCRATDDLLMSAELHPAYAAARTEFAQKPLPALLVSVPEHIESHESFVIQERWP